MRKTLSYLRRAVEDYHMIQPGDRIAAGVSGGKDSTLLLAGLAELRRFYPNPFEVVAITLDMGFEGTDFTPLREFCGRLGVEFRLIPTEIARVVFDIRGEPNPCSLCAKMRRGVLHDAAKAAGCNKVALGHHFDDAVETFFLNLMYEGRLGCFSPVTYLDRKDITLIRPMLYVPEKYIRHTVKRLALPVLQNPCKANGNTKRQEIKNLIHTLDKTNRGLRERVFGAMQRSNLSGMGIAEGGGIKSGL